ncbi:MAG: ABC transporter permease [bacterium]|nr:ABC transporter permease [bacterium]
MRIFARISYILRFKDLIRSFVARDLKTRYRGSTLGFLWSFLDPLINSAVLWLVFSFIFARNVPNLPVFLIAGVITWNFFAGSIGGATTSIISNGNLIKKIRLPREVFPISGLLANLVHYLLAFVVLIVIILISQPPFNPLAWLTLPIIIFLLAVIALGIGLCLAALSVYFRDLPHLTDSILRIWYFLTPIFYPITLVPDKYLNYYLINPASSGLTAIRQVVIEGRLPDQKLFIILAVEAVLLLCFGNWIFSKMEGGFADEI